MPKAGKKHFPYTKAGKKRAQKYAKKHGLKVKGSKNPGYGFREGTIMNKEELAGESVWNTYKGIASLLERHKPLSEPRSLDQRREEAAKKAAKTAKKHELIDWTTYRSMANLISDEVTKGTHGGKPWTVKSGPEISQDPKERQRLALQNKLSLAKTESARKSIRDRIAAL